MKEKNWACLKKKKKRITVAIALQVYKSGHFIIDSLY